MRGTFLVRAQRHLQLPECLVDPIKIGRVSRHSQRCADAPSASRTPSILRARDVHAYEEALAPCRYKHDLSKRTRPSRHLAAGEAMGAAQRRAPEPSHTCKDASRRLRRGERAQGPAIVTVTAVRQ